MGKLQIRILSIIIATFILLSPLQSFATNATDETVINVDAQAEDIPTVDIGGGPSWPAGPQITSESAVVMDYDSGTIVYAKAPTERHYPASITKVLTALVALENSTLDEKVTFSYNAVHSLEKGSSSISRDVDEVMTMEECIYGLLLESANECANAIAEHVSGSIEAFADLMNKKAKELGCVNSHFANANGLHDDNHYTCAYDMALISRAAYDNPTFALITGTKTYSIPPTNKHSEVTPLNNHHAMLHYFRTNKYIKDYCVGGKTGYTSKALSTLVTYGKKDGTTLIVVTMCAPGSEHYVDTTALMEYYFASLQTIRISELGERITQIAGSSISRLMGGEEVPFEVDTKSSILLPQNADYNDIKVEYVKGRGSGNEVGWIDFEYDGKNIGQTAVIGKDVEAYPFKNIASDDNEPNEANQYVVINIYKILLIIAGVVLLLLVAVFAIFRTNTAIATARRKRIENRDPHKNMRRIRRRRRKRRNQR